MPEYQPFRPVSAFLGGMEASQKLIGGQQDIRAREKSYQDYLGRQSALTSYAETGDIKSLMKYDPEMVMRLDDARAKKLEEGIGLVYKAAPFLLQQAGDPRSWDAFASDLKKFGVPDAITSGLTTGQPQERVNRLNEVVRFAQGMEVDLFKRKTAITTGAQKDIEKYKYENVTAPLSRLQASLATDLAEKTAQFKSTYDRKTAEQVMPKELATDMTRILASLETNYGRQQVELEKELAYLVPNEAKGYTREMVDADKRRAREELRRAKDEAYNQAIDSFRPLAEKFKVPLPAPRPLAPTAVGPAGGIRLTPEQRKMLEDAINKAKGLPPRG